MKEDLSCIIPEVTSPVFLTDKDIKQMIETQIREALAHPQGTVSIPKGRTYPEQFDLVPYLKGFVPASLNFSVVWKTQDSI